MTLTGGSRADNFKFQKIDNKNTIGRITCPRPLGRLLFPIGPIGQNRLLFPIGPIGPVGPTWQIGCRVASLLVHTCSITCRRKSVQDLDMATFAQQLGCSMTVMPRAYANNMLYSFYQIGPPKGIEVRDLYRFFSILIDWGRFSLKIHVLYIGNGRGILRNCLEYI